MRYNQAAFIGQQRSKDAQMKLFNYAGYAMLTYTIKQSSDKKEFLPVGDQILVAKMIYDNQLIIYITDEEGYAKAQSKPLNIEDGERIFNRMVNDGIKGYDGQIKTI